MKNAYLGGGCFWCTESVFLQLKGVTQVVSGYAGGKIKNPTYKEICSGMTGHAELIRVTYDPDQISFKELLEVHFHTHDPTTLNRQGNDVGTQYRSVVFYTAEEEKTAIQDYISNEASSFWDNPIVTSLEKLTEFYPAEAYHQNYFELNPGQGYCRIVIGPKVEKFRKRFKDKLKTS